MLSEYLYRDINAWVEETFGKNRDVEGVMEHLEEEVEELLDAIRKHKDGWVTIDDVLFELADVQIILFNLMGLHGICYNRYSDAVITKHGVNKKREWKPDPGSKKIKHVPSDFKIDDVGVKITCVACKELFPIAQVFKFASHGASFCGPCLETLVANVDALKFPGFKKP